jgi:hypothetical protein
MKGVKVSLNVFHLLNEANWVISHEYRVETLGKSTRLTHRSESDERQIVEHPGPKFDGFRGAHDG